MLIKMKTGLFVIDVDPSKRLRKPISCNRWTSLDNRKIPRLALMKMDNLRLKLYLLIFFLSWPVWLQAIGRLHK